MTPTQQKAFDEKFNDLFKQQASPFGSNDAIDHLEKDEEAYMAMQESIDNVMVV